MGETTEFDASKLTSNPVAESFIASFGKAKHETEPFDHWLFGNTLPEEDVDALIALSSRPPKDIVLDGKRETNNAFRLFFTRENQEEFSVCRRIAAGFKDPRVKKAIEETTGTDLSRCHLRIEYCQDGAREPSLGVDGEML